MTNVLGIVEGGELVSEEKWITLIEGLENDCSDLEMNPERGKRKIASVFEVSMKRRCSGKFGVMLSGGVDSSLIAFTARKLGADFTCYSVGLEGSNDLVWAQKVAQQYGLSWKHKVLSADELAFCIKKVIGITGKRDIVTVSVGVVGFAAASMAKSEGYDVVFSGLGSEEIFAGYKRHTDALGGDGKNYDALHKECWKGLKGMWARDLVRDFAIGGAIGVSLGAPFLDRDLIVAAMSVHPMFKVDETFKKVVLRQSAELIGLDKEFAWRKKQAAQYGSSVVKGVERLAKANGHQYMKEYLESV